MTNKFTILNHIVLLPNLNKTAQRKPGKLNKFSKRCDRRLLSFNDWDSSQEKRSLSNCGLGSNLKTLSRGRNLQLSEKFVNVFLKKISKRTKRRRVFSEERPSQKPVSSILEKMNMMKDKQYEEFIQKIGDKVNTAKNFKMYGLQSNRRLILSNSNSVNYIKLVIFK